MYQRVRRREGKTLLVKEVVLPCGRDSSKSRKDSTFWSNDKVITGNGLEVAGHGHMETGKNGTEEVLSLMVLQEKPQEDYFEGTRKRKKIRKRKRKHDRTVIPPSKLFSDGTKTLSKEERKQTEKALSEEEKTEIRLLDLKIYEYEKKREEACRKNFVRQKMAEEDYICQLENLLAGWCKTEKRKETEESPKKRTMKEISSSSRECHSEKPECSSGKSKKVFKDQTFQLQSSDSVLEDEFYEKLVFVDVDSDEFDDDG